MNPDFSHLDIVLFLNTASRNACVWDCSWDKWRAVALCQALTLSLQYRWIASVLEKNNPKTLNKLCLMEINFFFSLLCNDLDNVLAVCFWRTGKGERRAEMELCMPVSGCYGADYDVSKLGVVFF